MYHLKCAFYFKWYSHFIEEEHGTERSQTTCSKANSSQVAKLGSESRSDVNETQEPILLILGILLREDEVGRQVSEDEVKKLKFPSKS